VMSLRDQVCSWLMDKMPCNVVQGDDDPEDPEHSTVRHEDIHLPFFSSVAECQFGKSLHEIGSTWFADLGPPFGVMYCIKCECIPVSTGAHTGSGGGACSITTGL
jgi:hypothetical protein